MKRLALLLSVLFGMGCGPMDQYTRVMPICDIQPLVSTYIVQCGDGTATCSDATGKPRYVSCDLPSGNELVSCVEVCHGK